MLDQPIQFEHSKNEREITVLLPQQLVCLRQTVGGLEFVRETSNGGTGVIAVDGLNLGALRREVLRGEIQRIHTGPFGPGWSRCIVVHIGPRYAWSKDKEPLAPDPNSTPEECFQLETGTSRDVLPRRSLEAFAVARGAADQFLLQFRDRHSYILTACPGTFTPMLARMKAANFGHTMPNQFAPSPATVQLPGILVNRFVLQSVEHKPGNLAEQSRWQVILDFRPARSLRPSIGIDI
jgi:hypothetical protein